MVIQQKVTTGKHNIVIIFPHVFQLLDQTTLLNASNPDADPQNG